MKRFANAWAILYGSVCAGLAVVSAWKVEAVPPIALIIGAAGTSIAALINPAKFYKQ